MLSELDLLNWILDVLAIPYTWQMTQNETDIFPKQNKAWIMSVQLAFFHILSVSVSVEDDVGVSGAFLIILTYASVWRRWDKALQSC